MPQGARKRAKTSEIGVRDRLLDAADRLFYREGVRAVGIDRVLAEAAAAKASLYQHFGCKDQLVASYLERRDVAGGGVHFFHAGRDERVHEGFPDAAVGAGDECGLV